MKKNMKTLALLATLLVHPATVTWSFILQKVRL